jgi:hypothetical protein
MLNFQILRKSEDVQRYTLGVVYEPDVADTDNEFAKAEDIEKAAWQFLSDLQSCASAAAQIVKTVNDADDTMQVQLDITELHDLICKGAGDGLDDQHLQVTEHVGTIVESYLAPVDFDLADQRVTKGTWLLGVIWTPEMFEKIQTGERTGLSMFGRAQRLG